jgi:large subunit ribosomal protein L24
MAIKTNIIKGDTVLVRRGKEKGKRGTVKAVNRMLGTATVEGINIVKRHTKQGTKSGAMASQQTGGIIEKESPLPISVLQYVCEKCKAPTRVRRARTSDGKVHRVCARCGEPARESAKGA